MLKTLLILFPLCLLISITPSMADKRHHSGEGFEFSGDHKFKSSKGHRGGDKGNETTGQIAVWLLLSVNLTVAASILVKSANRFLRLSAETKKSLTRFNQTQKKYLMKFHYYLNPCILAIAFLHWSLSRCRSTSLPEWGLILMAILAGLGIILKLKLAPQTSIKYLYKVHTNPGVLATLILVLLTGHLIVD
ncbi:MAG: hypothetical protein WAW37_17595 [Syntrophobacteraceae bacterium]